MSKKIVRKPQNQIKYLLEDSLKREVFAIVMRKVSKLTKSDEQWKYYYHDIKSTLASNLSQSNYQDVVRQLNVIVRPYRKE